MKRLIHATQSELPLGDYSTRNKDRAKNDYYWQLRTLQTSNPDDIDYFANSPDYWDRYRIAMNPNTPDEILKMLMEDSQSIVREAADKQYTTKRETGSPYWSNNQVSPAFDYRYFKMLDDGTMVPNPPRSEVASHQTEDDELNREPDSDDAYALAESDDFIQIEYDTTEDLGLYIDMSSVRGDYGMVLIYSDPEHENNCDMWMGPEEALITKMKYRDYMYGVVSQVVSYPKRQWKRRYKKYLTSLVNQAR